MWERRALMSLTLLSGLMVAEVLSEGTRSVWGAREGARRGGLVWGRTTGKGAACWGPGVWPHPSHCRMFSLCRMTPDSGIEGMLLLCPQKTAFSTRMGRCVTDKTRCSQHSLPQEFESSPEMNVLQSINRRNYRCKFPRPFCASDAILTVCAPNFNLIGNVSCAGTCRQDKDRAYCLTDDPKEDSQADPATTVTASPTTTAAPSTQLSTPKSINITTTSKFDPPVLNADLVDSAIKITTALGLTPNIQALRNSSYFDTSKPKRPEAKPGLPAYTAPVFDFNSSSEESSYEAEQSEEDTAKPPFSMPVIVLESNIPVTTNKPLVNGGDSQIFTVELVRPTFNAGAAYQTAPENAPKWPVDGNSSTGRYPPSLKPTKPQVGSVGSDYNKEDDKLITNDEMKEKLEAVEDEKKKLEEEILQHERFESEKLEKERVEKERLEKERLEKERLEKERLEKERLEKERLEKERLEKERLEKERLEKEKLEKKRLEKEKLEKERLEKERLEKERLEKEKLEMERLMKEKLEKERLEKERLEKERLEKERLEKERLEKERLEKERLEKERLEKERLENERLEKEKLEKERLEKERLMKERLEKERLEKERLEKERLEKERLEKERLEKERLEKQRLEKERLENERLEKEKLEKERIEKERLEKERLQKLEKERLEKLESERLEQEKQEKLQKERIEKLEQERLEQLEKERIEKLEKKKIEQEMIEKEKVERERLENIEKERMEKERMEKEKLEQERLEKEKLENLERQKLEKLEKERLEKLEEEKKRLEIERLEKLRIEQERIEKERLEKLEKKKLEELENERLEKLKIDKMRIEEEKQRVENEKLKKLEEERLHKEKIEKERLEKLEQERLEKEKMEAEKEEKLKKEKEKLEKENLERDKVEKENMQREKEKEELEKFIKEVLESQGEKEQEEELEKKNITYVQSAMHPFSEDIPTLLSTVCTRPGLLCANHMTLVECSNGLVPLKAWDCNSFFARSATLNAKCDSEKDSCVAIVEDSLLPTQEELNQSGVTSPLCKKPGPQCVDSATLIHCSSDLKSATVAVCADLFPRYSTEATCDYNLEACVVGLDGDDNSNFYELSQTTSFPDSPLEVLPPSPGPHPSTVIPFHPTQPSNTTNKVNLISNKHSFTRNQTTTEKNLVTSTPPTLPSVDTIASIFPATRNPCRKPGLRCLGGTILEACEKNNPKPVYKMDCSTVLANSLDARCEEYTAGEASCMVELRRSPSPLKLGQKYSLTQSEEDVFTLELSVTDVTRTFDQSDSEIPSWNCTRSGQYCADDSTLLSCNSDLSLEFALACGAIAPASVVAFCDYSKNACVVRKISDLIANYESEGVFNSESNDSSKGGLPEKTSIKESNTSMQNANTGQQNHDVSSDNILSSPEWDFSTISQLYPPDVPLNAYGENIKQGQNQIVKGDINSPVNAQSPTEIRDPLAPGYLNKCTKPGPICLDSSHLGSCSTDLELQYVLPCSALYTGDSNSVCDSQLSACLPSSAKTTTTASPTTTTTIATTTTTTTTARPRPPVRPNVFIPQQIPSYTQYQYNSPITNIPRPPPIQENQFNNLNQFPSQQSSINSYQRPGFFQFFQRPISNNQPTQQQARPSFFQNLLQNYGIRLPSVPQTVRPTIFGSQNTRPNLGPFPILSSIFQSSTSPKPAQVQSKPTIPEDYGQEPYDFNDPQYVHPEGLASQGSNPHHRVSGLTTRPVNISPSINPKFYEEILKYLNREQQGIPNVQSAIHESEQDISYLGNLEGTYFDRFLAYLSQKTPENENKFGLGQASSSSSRPYRPKDTQKRPDFAESDKIAPQTGSIFQLPGGMSNINPITWVDKVQLDGLNQVVCRRPGMQCVDDKSLGACSSELVLQYVIPCRNLLPFVTIGKAFCDEKNDACAVMVAEDPSEYPMDYSSYP